MMSKIIPYVGYEDWVLTKDLAEVKKLLKEKGERFSMEHWPNKGCTPEVAWDVIRIGDSISMFFAKDKMFKIYFENSFDGSLDNGIRLGDSIDSAMAKDPTLKYDDWEEEYISDLGYWLEDDVESGKIISMTVFIKELEDDDLFYSYNWC